SLHWHAFAILRLSSARTTKRFPASRCASAIQIVRPLASSLRRSPNSTRRCEKADHRDVSGTALSDTATYNSATFGSLGVTPRYLCLDLGRTRTSRSRSDRWVFLMAARQFLCSAALCSGWLLCDADWVAKPDFVRS